MARRQSELRSLWPVSFLSQSPGRASVPLVASTVFPVTGTPVWDTLAPESPFLLRHTVWSCVSVASRAQSQVKYPLRWNKVSAGPAHSCHFHYDWQPLSAPLALREKPATIDATPQGPKDTYVSNVCQFTDSSQTFDFFSKLKTDLTLFHFDIFHSFPLVLFTISFLSLLTDRSSDRYLATHWHT